MRRQRSPGAESPFREVPVSQPWLARMIALLFAHDHILSLPGLPETPTGGAYQATGCCPVLVRNNDQKKGLESLQDRFHNP